MQRPGGGKESCSLREKASVAEAAEGTEEADGALGFTLEVMGCQGNFLGREGP